VALVAMPLADQLSFQEL
jgi:hypothetical protein